MSSIQYESIRTFCPQGHISVLSVLGHFRLKTQTKKIDKVHTDFELYQVFMYQTVLIFHNIYIYKTNQNILGLEISVNILLIL